MPGHHPTLNLVGALERLARVARLADEVADDADAPLRAAGACNLAALIASDCAMPDLARALCWTQFDFYQAARPAPCGENTAKLILQPLVNLARLRIRGGEADVGRQILQSLYDAARSSGGQAVIDGRAVSLPALATPPARHSRNGCGPSCSPTASAPCAKQADGPKLGKTK